MVEKRGVGLFDCTRAAFLDAKTSGFPPGGANYVWKPDDGEGTAEAVYWAGRGGWVTKEDGTKRRLTPFETKKCLGEEHRCPKCADLFADAASLRRHKRAGRCKEERSDWQRRIVQYGRLRALAAREAERGDGTKETIKDLQGNVLECVETFKYLGTTLSASGTPGADIQRRTGIAMSVIDDCREHWRSKALSWKTKSRLYHALVLSVALYNSETWRLDEKWRKRLRIFQRLSLDVVEGKTWWSEAKKDKEEEREEQDVDDNDEEWESLEARCQRLGVKPIEELIEERLETWLRHLLRSPRPETAALDSIDSERVAKSGWWAQVEALLERRGQSWDEFKKMCEIDRVERSRGKYLSLDKLRAMARDAVERGELDSDYD